MVASLRRAAAGRRRRHAGARPARLAARRSPEPHGGLRGISLAARAGADRALRAGRGAGPVPAGDGGCSPRACAACSGDDAVEDRAATERLVGGAAGVTWRAVASGSTGRWTCAACAATFQRRVLEATAALPYGAVASYAGIAARIGEPSAVRPVAQALRWNPLPIVIPCHRVIGSTRHAHRLRRQARGAQAAPARRRGRGDGSACGTTSRSGARRCTR